MGARDGPKLSKKEHIKNEHFSWEEGAAVFLNLRAKLKLKNGSRGPMGCGESLA